MKDGKKKVVRGGGLARTSNSTTEKIISFKGVDIYTREVGEGPAILLINGLGAHTAMYESMEATLEGFRLLQFDLPGAGKSAVPLVPMSVSQLAQLAAVVLDHFGVKRAHVVGYSMGGIVAQQLAHDAPERVQRMVLLASTPGRGSFRGDLRATLNMFTPVRYFSPYIYDMTIGSTVGGRARHDKEWTTGQGLLRLKHPPTWRGYVWQVISILRWSGFPILRKIQHEVLVLAGEDDPMIPVVNAMMLTHMLPNGRLLVIPDEGHMMMADTDSRIHPLIQEFFTTKYLKRATFWDEATAVEDAELDTALRRARRFAIPWSADAMIRYRWLRKSMRNNSSARREASLRG
jgi:poly(3-hydroxyoctanoate) depolymerase